MRKVSNSHVHWLQKELPILERQGVVSAETANRLNDYYRQTQSGLHWAVLVFAVLGSLLIASGIILLFAHNWEELSRSTRTVLSLSPIIVGAGLSFIALRKNGGPALRESAGIFHALSVGASIGLIGQTYHIPGNVPAFFLTWMLLILPLPFLLRSTGAGLVYLALACGWSGVAQEDMGQAAGFWLLILPGIARVVHLIRKDRHSPDTLLNLWGVLLALCISTGLAFERTLPGLWIIAYAALLSGAGLMGMHLYGERESWSNPARLFGIIGISVLTYIFTFEASWDDIGWTHMRTGRDYRAWGPWLDGGITIVFLAGWAAAAFKTFRKHTMETITLSVFPMVGLLCFFLGSIGTAADTVNALVFNGFMLFLGIMYIVMGCQNTRLRQLNGGMGILSLLLITRFFDADFGYMARGIVFIVLGACFLMVNLVMMRRKKTKEVVA